jgi:REP element-mobilizing transposase RayT
LRHEMWLLIILRMRKSCMNNKTIAKIIIIREKLYSKYVMWSILRYNTSSDHSHILI